MSNQIASNQIDGGFICTAQSDLAAYDRLPRPIRDILKAMMHDLAAEAIERDLRIYGIEREIHDLRMTNLNDIDDEREDRRMARGCWAGNVPLVAESRAA